MEREDPYRTLGIPPDSDGEAIRLAYLRAVRGHPPERDPQGFARIRRAYELLLDPSRRASWDAEHGGGGQVRSLVEQGERLLRAGKARRASSRFKGALLLRPDLPRARELLVEALLRRRRFQEAIREADRLVRSGGDGPECLVLAARARRELAEHLAPWPRKREALLKKAQELLDEADNHMPGDRDLVLERARLLLLQGRPEEALQVLERTRPDALPTHEEILVQIALIHVDRCDRRAFQSTLWRIQNYVPGGAAEAGLRFVAEARRRAARGDLHSLPWLVRAADYVAGRVGAVRGPLRRLRDLLELLKERERLPPQMLVLRRLVGLEVDWVRAPRSRHAEVLAQWGAAVSEVLALHPPRLAAAADLLRRTCPVFCRRNEDVLRQMEGGGPLDPDEPPF